MLASGGGAPAKKPRNVSPGLLARMGAFSQGGTSNRSSKSSRRDKDREGGTPRRAVSPRLRQRVDSFSRGGSSASSGGGGGAGGGDNKKSFRTPVNVTPEVLAADKDVASIRLPPGVLHEQLRKGTPSFGGGGAGKVAVPTLGASGVGVGRPAAGGGAIDDPALVEPPVPFLGALAQARVEQATASSLAAGPPLTAASSATLNKDASRSAAEGGAAPAKLVATPLQSLVDQQREWLKSQMAEISDRGGRIDSDEEESPRPPSPQLAGGAAHGGWSGATGGLDGASGLASPSSASGGSTPPMSLSSAGSGAHAAGSGGGRGGGAAMYGDEEYELLELEEVPHGHPTTAAAATGQRPSPPARSQTQQQHPPHHRRRRGRRGVAARRDGGGSGGGVAAAAAAAAVVALPAVPPDLATQAGGSRRVAAARAAVEGDARQAQRRRQRRRAPAARPAVDDHDDVRRVVVRFVRAGDVVFLRVVRLAPRRPHRLVFRRVRPRRVRLRRHCRLRFPPPRRRRALAAARGPGHPRAVAAPGARARAAPHTRAQARRSHRVQWRRRGRWGDEPRRRQRR